ncbi:hypothetical protein [Pseudomonas sp. ZL2]
MDTRELPGRKRELEEELNKVIQSAVDRFRKEAGVDVVAIDVNVFRVYSLAEEPPPRSIGSVMVTLDL